MLDPARLAVQRRGGRGLGCDRGRAAAPGFVPHVAFGMAILALVVLRLIVRLSARGAEAPGTPGSLQVKAADWGHRLIYLLMIAVPLGGMSIWFWRHGQRRYPRAVFANVLMIVVLGHALMALYHQYVLKDGLLRRMMKAE